MEFGLYRQVPLKTSNDHVSRAGRVLKLPTREGAP